MEKIIVSVLFLAIGIAVQSYCMYVMWEMIDDLENGYNLIDGRISEINNRSYANELRCKENGKVIDYLLRKDDNNDL